MILTHTAKPLSSGLCSYLELIFNKLTHRWIQVTSLIHPFMQTEWKSKTRSSPVAENYCRRCEIIRPRKQLRKSWLRGCQGSLGDPQ
jgi:hypothetical protein